MVCMRTSFQTLSAVFLSTGFVEYSIFNFFSRLDLTPVFDIFCKYCGAANPAAWSGRGILLWMC